MKRFRISPLDVDRAKRAEKSLASHGLKFQVYIGVTPGVRMNYPAITLTRKWFSEISHIGPVIYSIDGTPMIVLSAKRTGRQRIWLAELYKINEITSFRKVVVEVGGQFGIGDWIEEAREDAERRLVHRLVRVTE